MPKSVVLLCIPALLFCSLWAESRKSIIFENDGITGTDKHYTNGFFYTVMDDKTNRVLGFEHLTFTPDKLESSKPVFNDLPYTGYAGIQWRQFYKRGPVFHDVGFKLGTTGRYSGAEYFQKGLHEITGNTYPKGWDHQLGDDMHAGLVYQTGYKSDHYPVLGQFIHTMSHLRLDAGTFYSAASAGFLWEIGSYKSSHHKTAGATFGSNTSQLLGMDPPRGWNWSFSYGVFYTKIFNFYVVDEGIKRGYGLANLRYNTGHSVMLSLFKDGFQAALRIKSVFNNTVKTDPANVSKWGGVEFSWAF